MSQENAVPLFWPSSPITFVGRDVVLRDFEEADFEAFFALVGNAEICAYLPWGPFDREGAQEFLRQNRAAIEANPRTIYRLAAVDPISGAMVGLAAAFVRRPELAELEVGYALLREYWGQGWASRILRALEDFVFGQFGAHRATAVVDPANGPSVRVLERAQFRREAHFVQAHRRAGQWSDELVFARLAEEWQARQGS